MNDSWLTTGGSAVFLLSIVVLGVLVLVFEVFMFIDVIKNKKLNDVEKLLWGAGMILFHPVISAVYYLTSYTKRKKSKPSKL